MRDDLMTGDIGIGLLGFGMAGRVFHAPLIAATPGLAITAIATSRGDEALAVCPNAHIVPDAAALLADPAVALVVVATPSHLHQEHAAMALRAGRHVVVEKPFALSLAGAEELAALARAAQRQLFVFHNRRWDSDFLAIQDAIASGLVGDVVHFESHFDRFRPQVRVRWREDGSPGSGVWLDLGPHLVDQALCLFGPPAAVTADLAVLRADGQSDDWAHVVLHWPGRRGVLHASMVAAGGSPRFTVHGTRGSLVKHGLDPQEAQLVAGVRPGDADWGRDDDPLLCWDSDGRQSERAVPRGSQQAFYHHVRQALTGTGTPPNTLDQALMVQRVIAAAQASAREGQTVWLDGHTQS
jgi:predicted dehydrogenase